MACLGHKGRIHNQRKMKIQLIDKNPFMCEAWLRHFSGCGNVTVHQGDFFSLPTKCIVSPGNSFGFMDGGLDAAIIERVGKKTEENVRKVIAEEFNGEILVGQAVLIATEYPEIPFCICAPTMRVPMSIRESVNVYLASKAIFRILMQWPEIKTVSISGLGTGFGNVPESLCAKQMYMAYHEVMMGNENKFETSMEAKRQHRYLLNSLL